MQLVAAAAAAGGGGGGSGGEHFTFCLGFNLLGGGD